MVAAIAVEHGEPRQGNRSPARRPRCHFPPAFQRPVCNSRICQQQEQETAMRLYQVNLPGGPVMVFAHTIQRAWIMAFTRYAYDCDPDPAFAWDATEEWLAASDGQRSEEHTSNFRHQVCTRTTCYAL